MKSKHFNKLQRKRAKNHYDRVKKCKQTHEAKKIQPLFEIV